MADNPIIITLPYTADLDRGPVEQYLPVAFGTGDKEAHRLVLTAYRSTGIVDLTGAGVLCYVNRADKTTVVVDGEVVDGKAVVLLPEECYIVNGVVSIIVKLTMGDTRATVLWLTGNINRTSNGKLVDPGGVVPTLEALLAEIDNMRTATSEGVAAAEEAREAAKEVEGAAEEARQAITELSQNTAPAIVQEASGDMVVITDAAARPALSLVSQITAVQSGSGDPSPDNIRPITGWDAVTLTRTGRNMLDPAAVTQLTLDTGETRWGMRYTQPGVYALSASVPGEDADYVYARVTDASGAAVGDTMYLVAGSTVRSYTVTLEAGQAVTVWYVRDLDYDTVVDCLTRTQVQVEMGSRTAYEAPQRVALTAALPETVYGGTFNWTTGQMTVTHRYVQMADMRVKTVGVGASGARYADLAYPDGFTPRTNAASFSNAYKYITTSQTAVSGTYRVYNTSLTVYDDRFESVEAAESILQALGFAAAVTTTSSKTTQLTSQQVALLQGYNTLWSDTGSTAVGYVADTKMYVEHNGGGGDDGYADYAAYAERAGEADTIGGMAVQAVSLADWENITPSAATIYLIYDAEVAT